MKKNYWLLLGLILIMSGCNSRENSSATNLELKISNPYQLIIHNFHWTHSTLGNTLNGNFDELDRQVYELLKGKEGICEVYLSDNHTGGLWLIGTINIQHINDAPNWLAWRRRGISSMLSWKIERESQQADSTVAEPYNSKLDTIVSTPSTVDTTKSLDQSAQSEADSTTVESN